MSLALTSRRAALMPGQWVRNELWRRAKAVPSLDLRFADNKSLVDAITGASLVTFTRASSGTYVDSQGVIQSAVTNDPRFDHDPTTGESLGLLVEEQRTNLALNSATFQPSSAGTPAVYTVDQIAPDGTTTASRQTAAGPRTFTDYTGIANAQYTFSVWVKTTSGTASGNFILNNAVSDTNKTLSTWSANTTWRRISITGTTDGATTGVRIELGAVISGVVFWGAQLEVGAFPTSYIPTTTAAVTRSADVASITGTAFSSWYRQDEGTFYVDAFRSEPVPSTAFSVVYDGRVLATDITKAGYFTEALASHIIISNSIVQSELYPSALSGIRRRRLASAHATNNFGITVNGNPVSTDTNGNPPSNIPNIFIGSVTGGSQVLNGTIRRFVFWPQRLPDSLLQAITQ